MLTGKEFVDTCKKHKYLIVTTAFGDKIGVNGGAWKLGVKRKRYNPNKQTKVESYYPCGLLEYIQNKTPFLDS